MKKQFVSILGAGLLMFTTVVVNAATILYTDSSMFKAALGTFTVYNFDNFVLGEGSDIYGFFDTLDQQIAGIDFDNARVNLGSFNGTSNSAPNVVLNADFINPIVIKFSQPQYGVGLFNTSLVDAEIFEVFGQNGELIGSVNLPHQIINFGGFTSDEGIAMAIVTPIAPTNGSIYIDDLTVGALPAPVPEPAIILLLGTGIAGLIGTKIRKKKSNFLTM